MDAVGGKPAIRRFPVRWDEMVTLADPEQVIVGVHTQSGDLVVLVEYCPELQMGDRVVRKGWGRKLTQKGDETEIRNFDNPSVAEVYIKSALRKVTMIRYRLQGDDGLVWTINRFSGENEGLSLAEAEVPDGWGEIVFPPWVDREGEVTGDPYYSLYMLASVPWKSRKRT